MSDFEAELVRRYRAGDEDAATQLHELYIVEMLQMVRRKLAEVRERGHFDSEGIVQSGFRSWFSAIKKPQFNEAQWNIGALLNTIVERKCLVQLRRKNKTISLDPEDLHLTIERVISAMDDAESAQELAAQWNEAFNAALADMTPLEVRIVMMSLDANPPRTLEEIAQACDCSLTKVKTTLKTLKDELTRLSKLDEDETE